MSFVLPGFPTAGVGVLVDSSRERLGRALGYQLAVAVASGKSVTMSGLPLLTPDTSSQVQPVAILPSSNFDEAEARISALSKVFPGGLTFTPHGISVQPEELLHSIELLLPSDSEPSRYRMLLVDPHVSGESGQKLVEKHLAGLSVLARGHSVPIIYLSRVMPDFECDWTAVVRSTNAADVFLGENKYMRDAVDRGDMMVSVTAKEGIHHVSHSVITANYFKERTASVSVRSIAYPPYPQWERIQHEATFFCDMSGVCFAANNILLGVARQ